MDGVIVDTEAYYQIEQREFFEEFGIEVSDEELLATVGASFQSFQRSLVDWLGRIGRVVTPDEALRIYRDWKNGREVDYAALMNPGVHEVLESAASATRTPRARFRQTLSFSEGKSRV